MTTIKGYGASLEFDDAQVVIHFAKMAASATGTKSLRIPLDEITDVKFRDASMIVNGEIKFAVKGEPASYAEPATKRAIEPSLVAVNFRKKDRDAFREAHAELTR